MLSGTDADEAAAVAAGRAVTITDAVLLAAFLDTGYFQTIGTLTAGTYTPSIRVTESRSGAGSYTGAWSRGSNFTVTTLSAPTSPTATLSTKTLSFTAAAGATGYIAYYSTDSSTPNTSSNVLVLGNNVTFIHPVMTSTYRYKIATVDQYGSQSALTATITPA